MEPSEESKKEIWSQLTRRRDFVGGTLVIYERGVERARDTISGSRMGLGAGYNSMTLIGKTGEKASFCLNNSRLKIVDGRYEVLCQPDGWDTYELAVAPKGVEIPAKS